MVFRIFDTEKVMTQSNEPGGRSGLKKQKKSNTLSKFRAIPQLLWSKWLRNAAGILNVETVLRTAGVPSARGFGVTRDGVVASIARSAKCCCRLLSIAKLKNEVGCTNVENRSRSRDCVPDGTQSRKVKHGYAKQPELQ